MVHFCGNGKFSFYISHPSPYKTNCWKSHFDGLVQERCNCNVLAMELCLSCTNLQLDEGKHMPTTWVHIIVHHLKLLSTQLFFHSLFRLPSKQTSNTHYWFAVRGTRWWSMDSPHKGPVMLYIISNHWQLNCFFNRLFRLPSKKTWKSSLLVCCGHIHWWSMDSPHKGPVMWKAFPCHDFIMFWS